MKDRKPIILEIEGRYKKMKVAELKELPWDEKLTLTFIKTYKAIERGLNLLKKQDRRPIWIKTADRVLRVGWVVLQGFVVIMGGKLNLRR